MLALGAVNPHNTWGFGLIGEGAIMGREEKRLHERVVHRLERRLRRKPTEEEVEQALAALHQAERKRSGRDPKR